MSEEIYGTVQVLELTGRAAGGLFRGIRMSAKAAAHGVDLARLKIMQLKMKLHFASTGKHNTMRLRDIEKLTGGNYALLNIPFEDEKNLIGFYDRLKKLNIPFSELPDLNIGDGYTQIAYNPQDADKIRTVVDYYKDKMNVEASEISLEKYEEIGGEKGKQLLDELAQKGYEKEVHVNLLQMIRNRNKDKNYIPITINVDALLKEETLDAYICNVPGTYIKGQGYQKTITVKKAECVLLDEGQTIYTHLKRGNPETDPIAKNWNKVSLEHRRASERIRLEDTDALPNFKTGQEPQKEPALENNVINKDQDLQKEIGPEEIERNREQEKQELTSLDRIFEQPRPEESVKDFRGNLPEKELASLDHVLGKPETNEQLVGEILKVEGMKEKVSGDEYIPVTIPLNDCLVAETENIYVIKLPGSDAENAVEMLTIAKNDVIALDDKKNIQAFFKKEGNTSVDLHDIITGKKTGEKEIANNDLTLRFGRLKDQQKDLGTVKNLAVGHQIKASDISVPVRKR